VISGNNSIGLFFNGGGGSTAQGNYIGLGADGVTRVGNGGTGLDCQDGAGNLIGGTNPGEGNVISGNAQDGVLLYGTSDYTRIFGNLIGSDYTGTIPIGNHDWGIECQSAHNVIGSTDPGTRNLLSANGGSGIVLYSENVTKSMFNTVQGNYIGTDITGTKALGQSAWLSGIQQQGISFSFDAHDNLIGGTKRGRPQHHLRQRRGHRHLRQRNAQHRAGQLYRDRLHRFRLRRQQQRRDHLRSHRQHDRRRRKRRGQPDLRQRRTASQYNQKFHPS